VKICPVEPGRLWGKIQAFGIRMSKVYLGLGTNLGNRVENMNRAIEGLAEQIKVLNVSPMYETAAWGVEEQPDFLNLCLAGETNLGAWGLLRFVKDLEITLGREETVRWGPRLIDIDILLFGDLMIDEQGMTIPHKGIPARATVLVPLADIAPDLIHPLADVTIAEMLTKVDTSGVWPYVEEI